MKRLLLLTIIVAVSCTPRMRSPTQPDDTFYSAINQETPSATPTAATDLGSSTAVPRSDEAPTPISSIPDEIEHCSWSLNGISGFSMDHPHLGKFTICKNINPDKDTEIYIQLQNSITDSQLCIIPTYNSGSRSIYIGEPRCIFVQQSSRIYKVNMLKNRIGFQNFTITGVMIMKDKMYQYGFPYGSPYRWMLSVDAYLFCSNKLDTSTPDKRYCEAFAKVGQFVYKQFNSQSN